MRDIKRCIGARTRLLSTQLRNFCPATAASAHFQPPPSARREHFSTLVLRPFGSAVELSVAVWTSASERAGWPLVAVHGFGDNLSTWQRLTTAVEQRGGALWALDLPGFGRTPLPPEFARCYTHDCAALVLAFVRSLGFERCLLVGNSFGGAVALGAAALARHADEERRIAGLVLCSPATADTRPPPFVHLARTPAYRAMHALAHVLPRAPRRAIAAAVARAGFRAMLAAPARPHAAWFAAVRDALERRTAWRDLEAIARHIGASLRGECPELETIAGALRTLDVPVVVLRGARDGVIGDAELRSLVARLPDARLETVADAAHCVQNERPELVADELLELARRAGLTS